jgi:hypothetical protein
MNPKQIIENIPTGVLLKDAENHSTQSPEERGFNVAKNLQRGALTCLAASIPLFVLKNHEWQMTPPLHNQTYEQSIDSAKSTSTPIPKNIDMSTLQDAVSGLGFILDPPAPSTLPEMIIHLPSHSAGLPFSSGIASQGRV